MPLEHLLKRPAQGTYMLTVLGRPMGNLNAHTRSYCAGSRSLQILTKNTRSKTHVIITGMLDSPQLHINNFRCRTVMISPSSLVFAFSLSFVALMVNTILSIAPKQKLLAIITLCSEVSNCYQSKL